MDKPGKLTPEARIKVVRNILKTIQEAIEHWEVLDAVYKENQTSINLLIKDLEQNYELATNLNNAIIAHSEEENVAYIEYISDNIYSEIHNLYFLHATTLHGMLKILTSEEQVLNGTQIEFSRYSTYQPNNPNYNNPNESINLALSTLNIPVFDGDYDKWPDFRDSFESSVHNNSHFNNVTKLKILQNHLKGEALKIIKRDRTKMLNSENYSNIWELLIKRYNHKRSLVNSYFHMLFYQEMIEKENSTNLKKLYDTTFDALGALKNMNLEVDNWGDILVFLVHSKLPSHTKELWDEKLGKSDELPTFDMFMDFLETRFRTLESVEATRNTFNNTIKKSQNRKTTLQTSKNQNTLKKQSNQNKHTTIKCKCCNNGNHSLRQCFKFKKLDTQARINLVNSNNCCYNCLSASHKLAECKSEYKCSQCGYRHHSLLHLESKLTKEVKSTTASKENLSAEISFNEPSCSNEFRKNTYVSNADLNVIFPTALLKVATKSGGFLILRALIDACSDASYITEQAANKLQLKKNRTHLETSGLGDSNTGCSNYFVSIEIESRINSFFKKNLRAYVLPKIATHRPVNSLECNDMNLPKNISLADPKFQIPGKIDILLGGEIDAQIQLTGIIKSGCGNIIFRETKLGWLVSGAVAPKQCFVTNVTNNKENVLLALNKTLKNFWEIEEFKNKRIFTKEELSAEEFYKNTTKRLSDGRYMVNLPFKNEIENFTNMKKIAFSRFSHLERKLSTNENLRKQYHACLQEYIDMGHMVEVDSQKYPNGYYLPHHCVIKESSSTTKLRVVFDASARDSNLQSLNENLFTGPRLQADLLDLLLKFRTFKFAVTADIEKMYRQILINPNDVKYQLILWRFNSSENLKTFALNTVTFGTSAAPYLAIKTLYQLASDEKDNFPIGSKCLETGFYVDDFIYGGDTLEETLEIQRQTCAILKSAGLHLRKWSANHDSLLENIAESDRETKSLLSFEKDLSIKTLGIKWSPVNDEFTYQIEIQDHKINTKRTTLSDIAKIFDPLGWIAPCVILAKILIQDIWIEKLDWDDELPSNLNEKWSELKHNLSNISRIKIPRWINTLYSDCPIELHGFSDASEKAYAAQIYIKTTVNNTVYSNLLLAKTKVSPIQRISVPRLELCAAVLLAKLVEHVKNLLSFPDMKIYCWSDSTITLSWIKDSPHKRSTYVANRVAEIQSLTCPSDWRHVRTHENPADLGTRGVLPEDLVDNLLWWHGPSFLKSFNENDEHFISFEAPSLLPPEENKSEKSSKKLKSTNILQEFLPKKMCFVEISSNIKKFQSFENEKLNKFSTLSKLCRVVAYCKRIKKANRKMHLYIDPQEFDDALLTIVRMVQNEVYSDEISKLKNQQNLQKSNKIYSLNPFISEKDNLLRLNSRLSKANHISYDQKFPIILPHNHSLSHLIVRDIHLKTLHGTHQEMLMLMCQRFHILKMKSLVKDICNKCVICFRYRSGTLTQKMGQLPSHRITPDRPFANCGVDFAGPFDIKMWKGRCNKLQKAYFSIFICFAIKAVHLEVVTDLSTDAFIAAYRRFIARRGIAKNIYSDCGTNFVGAEKRITRSLSECNNNWNLDIAKALSEFKTKWHFNPPASPHFGGLWEAGVKSTKHHLKRVLGSTKLTYDEFETLLLQIEACLNSRPLTKIEGDPSTIILTPSHFLIQGALNSLPDHNLIGTKIPLYNRWNHLQLMLQEFWKLWSFDYLNTLRQREKWKAGKENLKINDIVLIKENNLPPTVWLLGKVIEVHPDSEGLIRVATVKTEKKVYKRPIVKLAPLPLNN